MIKGMTATQVVESGKDSNNIQKREVTGEVTDNTERVKRSDKGSP